MRLSIQFPFVHPRTERPKFVSLPTSPLLSPYVVGVDSRSSSRIVRIVRRGAFCFLRFALFLLFLSTFDFSPPTARISQRSVVSHIMYDVNYVTRARIFGLTIEIGMSIFAAAGAL